MMYHLQRENIHKFSIFAKLKIKERRKKDIRRYKNVGTSENILNGKKGKSFLTRSLGIQKTLLKNKQGYGNLVISCWDRFVARSCKSYTLYF